MDYTLSLTDPSLLIVPFVDTSLAGESQYSFEDDFKYEYVSTKFLNHICQNTVLHASKNIRVKGRTIIEPHVEIRGDLANVMIGQNCIVGERSVIRPPTHQASTTGERKYVTVSIGDYVIIESDCTIEAASIGAYVHIEKNVHINKRCILSSCCKIMQDTVLAPGTVCPPFSIFAGSPGVLVGRLPESFQTLVKDIASSYYRHFLAVQKLKKEKKAGLSSSFISAGGVKASPSPSPPLLDNSANVTAASSTSSSSSVSSSGSSSTSSLSSSQPNTANNGAAAAVTSPPLVGRLGSLIRAPSSSLLVSPPFSPTGGLTDGVATAMSPLSPSAAVGTAAAAASTVGILPPTKRQSMLNRITIKAPSNSSVILSPRLSQAGVVAPPPPRQGMPADVMAPILTSTTTTTTNTTTTTTTITTMSEDVSKTDGRQEGKE